MTRITRDSAFRVHQPDLTSMESVSSRCKGPLFGMTRLLRTTGSPLVCSATRGGGTGAGSARVAPKVLQVPDGYICDYVDQTHRRDTPEEYIRQMIEKRIVIELGYPLNRIGVENPVVIGSRQMRADIVIFREFGGRTQDDIFAIIECKSAKVRPSDRKIGVGQLKSYMAACPNCEWGMWTNGSHREVVRKIRDNGGYLFEEYNDIPAAGGSVEEIDRPSRDKLQHAADDNLMMAFRSCHNHIYSTDGLEKDQAFFELLKVIFCKTYDEQSIGNPLEFYAKSREASNIDGCGVVKNRIDRLFDKVKRRYPMIFVGNDKLSLRPQSLARVVATLQPYSLLDTHIDVKGKAYEELVGANLRGDRGEFFTPRNVVNMAVKMVAPTPDELICDPACGTGGFLVMAMKHIIEKIQSTAEKTLGKPKAQWSHRERETVRDEIRHTAERKFFGFDISQTLVKAAKMNMVMNNDGSGNIYQGNSLLHPHLWDAQMRDELAKALHISPDEIKNERAIEFFDVIFTNPPFGSKIPVDDRNTLEQYQLGYIWRNEQQKVDPKSEWTITENFQKSAPPEQLFIERCLQFLKPGGRMAIVLPDSILSNPGLGYIRDWLIKETRIIASIDLHADTFQPRNGTQTSVLILQKKSRGERAKEEREGKIRPYNLFMAVASKIGHDKRGNIIYARDHEGNEIWVDDGAYSEGNDDNKIPQKGGKRRVIDDQTAAIADIFSKWKKQEGVQW